MEKTNIKQDKTQNKSKRLPALLRLNRRACVFLFITLGAFFVFYTEGSYQKFLDSNIIIILHLISFTSIALCFFSITAIFGTFFFSIKDKKWNIFLNIPLFLITLITGISGTFFSLTVNMLSEGINF